MGRELTNAEVKKIEESVAKNIGWYDAITYALYEYFPDEIEEFNED
jgi:hypothetical protein